MGTTTTTDRRRIDTAITGFAILGVLLAIVEGLGVLESGNLVFVVTIGFPAVTATLVYLHFHPDEKPAIAVALGLWGIIAGAIGLFATFFVVMDNPALASDASLSSLLFASSITNFALGMSALSGLYAIAGSYKSRALVLVAPITQLLAFSIASYLVPIIT